MSSAVLARMSRARFFAARPVRSFVVSPVFKPTTAAAPFSSASRRLAASPADDPHDPHHEESFEEFTARYEKEFEQVQDVFELQRNLNNAFAYDLVPSPSVITAALRAARRVNDYPTAVRIFEGIKAKVENKNQYEEYLKELQSVREELGVHLKENMYPEAS
ncbi:Cytochrome c oxidase subunit 6, mitochondrial [Fulvia fulva]|uniref:Cytochrome c oxidase subunit 6, mitochondrial n=1 Tax=Passalora fulva TaxID=5499 RepID=A0A9Q8LJI1_PASFU|nr:Cytochrome c oxidase subunit 6, mitochondrial [Fulvia fulva]KAK4621412.1 Cytochrome c oxidase subunit 6, mitochondrial [Fulvia fulva]KAK4622778.1 Cytochrome c oxidase subunit 6, mitochondrial [Fulvia fulva]UJO18558.1 Cytochrome c oxidase subunit 6, mitochondrial [Fulvia fulva]WPV15884.1 Cytochrome c oxidase subunit 6, mitochondrial [Fulvia fulva]WPV31620.1 Cytochrome c oxidase subunit 6, mitochondrial [Fulvia fulva]